MSFDRVVVSTNEDKNFILFLPLVVASWKRFFPKVEVDVAFVTNRFNSDPLVEEMRRYAPVKLFQDLEGYPTANLAKVSRFILASSKNDTCMIEDIDTIPLQKDFFRDRTSQRQPKTLLAVGREVLAETEHKGKFPISTMTAEGHIFKSLINPKNLSYPDLVSSWSNIRIFDHKESITNSPHSFSDESLMRALISRWDKSGDKVTYVDRGINIHDKWIDRSWWSVDEHRLDAGEYVTCNFLRPLTNHYNDIEPVVDYIMSIKDKADLLRYIDKVETLL